MLENPLWKAYKRKNTERKKKTEFLLNEHFGAIFLLCNTTL